MRGTTALLAVVLLAPLPAAAGDKLARIIPNLFGPHGLTVDSEALLPSGETHSAHFNSSFQAEFTHFNVALASQLTSVAIPSPASGFTYSFDPSLGVFGVYQRSTQSFGPILADRAETVGRKKWSLGVSYQRYSFDTLEGVDLGEVPAVFTHDDPDVGGRSDVVTTVNSIETSIDQLAVFVGYGVGGRVDVSLAVPVLSARLAAVSNAAAQRIGTSDSPLVHFFRQDDGSAGSTRRFAAKGEASGVGDLIVRVKAGALERGSGGVALALDLRLPTGDEESLLGAGTLGLRPLAIASFSHGKLAPHLNVGYQWNGKSILAGDPVSGRKDDLPDQLFYIAGVDYGISTPVTLDFEIRGRTTFDSQRLRRQTFVALDGRTSFADIGFERSSFTTLDAAVGIKANVKGRLLLDANATFKLNDAGLRDSLTPLLGLEYAF